MKKSELKITEFKVYGVRNQNLIIEGKKIKENQELEIYLDKQKLDYDFEYSGNNFIINTAIPNRTRKIELVLKENNSFITSISVRNLMIKRVMRKLKEERKTISEKNKTRYYVYPKLGIEECVITGIKRPLFHVQGSLTVSKYSFKVFADNKEIEYDLLPTSNKKSFSINAKLAKKVKMVSLILSVDNEDIIILKYRNKVTNRIMHKIVNEIIYKFKNFIKRAFQKIKSTIKRILHKIKHITKVLIKGVKFAWREHHFLIPPSLWKKYYNDSKKKLVENNSIFLHPFIKEEYNRWLEIFEEKTVYEKLEYNPLISVVIPVYNVSEKLLSECLDSILNQKYQNFEICLADDNSTNKETIDTLKKYEKKDKRIKVVYRKENGHISLASNSALEIATGEFVAMMDNDDVIPENALYEMVKALNKDKTIDMIYTDEDKLDLEGRRCDPNFKSDYAPDTLLSNNYFCHFTLLRRSIMNEIGGWKKGYEGAQDYDLFLRFTEKTDRIHHIPKVLYHWRMIPGSTSMAIDNKNYAIERGQKALQEALKRRNISGEVLIHDKIPYYMIKYTYKKEPKVSILIPTRDYASTLEACLKSIYAKTTYKNYEIIVINNQSVEKETFNLFKKYKKEHKNFKVIDVNTEFNFSNLCNVGVEKATGDYIVLLNNDTELITEDWLQTMVGYAMQKHIGTVGVKLHYPDGTIQHGGVTMGLGGVAAHAFINNPRDDYGFYGRLAVPYNYSVNTAACIMVSKKKYLEVDGFEEKLKVAYNDVDFNLKLLEKGYYNVFLPQVQLYHYESKSRGLDTTTEKYKRFLYESDYMYKKWDKYIKNDPFYNPSFSKYCSFMLDSSKNMKGEPENEEEA